MCVCVYYCLCLFVQRLCVNHWCSIGKNQGKIAIFNVRLCDIVFVGACLCLRPNYRLGEIAFFCLKYWLFLSFIGCCGLGWGWGGVGVGWGMFAFMWSCTRCGCYVHRNGNVSTLTAKTLRKLAWRKDAWTRLFRCSETRNHPENGLFSIIDIDTLRTFRWGETTKILSLYCKSHAIMQTRNTAKPWWSTQRPRCNDKIALNTQPTIGPYGCLCVYYCLRLFVQRLCVNHWRSISKN